MYGHIPEAFTRVVLKDRSTWHNATLREWLDMRSFLKEKKTKYGDPGVWADRINHARIETHRRIGEEMNIHDTTSHPPRNYDSNKRYSEIMKELFYDRYPDYEPLSQWDNEYLSKSEWIDDLLEAYYSGTGDSSTVLLFKWLMTIEDEECLADKRAQQLTRYRDAVAISSRRRMKSRKNPFYPKPLELIHIARTTQLIMENIKREYDVYIMYGKSCGDTNTPQDKHIRKFMIENKWFDKIIDIIQELKRLGYMPCRNEQSCLEWTEWKCLFIESAWSFNRKFLAYIFDVSPDTVRKDLCQSRLQRLYDKYKIIKALRIFNAKPSHPRSSTLFRSGWTDRLQAGKPNRHDCSSTYFRMPRY